MIIAVHCFRTIHLEIITPNGDIVNYVILHYISTTKTTDLGYPQWKKVKGERFQTWWRKRGTVRTPSGGLASDFGCERSWMDGIKHKVLRSKAIVLILVKYISPIRVPTKMHNYYMAKCPKGNFEKYLRYNAQIHKNEN